MQRHIVTLDDDQKAVTIDLFDLMLDNLTYVRKNNRIISPVPQTTHIAAYVAQLRAIRDKVRNS